MKRTTSIAVIATLAIAGVLVTNDARAISGNFVDPDASTEKMGQWPAIVHLPVEGPVEGEYLFPGQALSGDCTMSLRMQTDGNLVIYDNSQRALWATNTVNSGGYAKMQSDGNFVVYNWADSAVWASGTVPNGCSGNCNQLDMQSDGNLVMSQPSLDGHGGWTRVAIWTSNTSGYSEFPQSPCPVNRRKTVVWSDMDAPGGDYHQIIPNEARASWCGYYCTQDSNCVAYTYVPPPNGSPTGECFLKNTVPTGANHSGFTTGVVYGVGPG